jgi:hypothetical protein
MTFGAPAALWGLLVLPLFVLLYLLRVRRREQQVSSILLWRRSAPSLAASRPARRIERSLLLLLQLLAVACLVLGLARPAVVGRGVAGRDVVLVLDGSLSMRARDVAPTRFDRARAEALDVVSRLAPGQRAAVVLAAPHPLLLAALTDDRRALDGALRDAAPWDAPGDVAAAVTLGAAQQPGPGGQILVWTDAARGPLPSVSGVTYRIIGTSDDNVGITDFRVLRDADGVRALVRVANDSSAAQRVPVEVRLGATLVYRRTSTVAPGDTWTVEFPVSGAGVLRARLDVHDVLPEDDEATAVIDPTPLPSVLLVSRGNPYLEGMLRVLPVSRAAETAAVAPATWGQFGIVILDRIDVDALPPGNYLAIGTVPPGLPVSAAGIVLHPSVAAWDASDPVLRFVDLSDVRIDRALILAPEAGRVLAAGPAPLLWVYDGGGVRIVLLAFALEDSDLPLHAAFPILMQNSLAWLGGTIADARVGDALEIPAGAASAATFTEPDGGRVALQPVDGVFVLPPLARAGLYRVSVAGGADRVFAAQRGSAAASVIRPGEAPAGTAAVPVSGPPAVSRTALVRVPLWPWLVAAALCAALGEWALATRRAGGDA